MLQLVYIIYFQTIFRKSKLVYNSADCMFVLPLLHPCQLLATYLIQFCQMGKHRQLQECTFPMKWCTVQKLGVLLGTLKYRLSSLVSFVSFTVALSCWLPVALCCSFLCSLFDCLPVLPSGIGFDVRPQRTFS